MKKVFLFLLLAVSFMACEGPEGPMGPMGIPGIDGSDGKDGRDGLDGLNGKDGKDGHGANWFAKSFTVQPNEWQLVGEENELQSYFVVNKKLPELTSEIFREKAVIAYIETENGVKNGMPYVLHKGVVNNEDKEVLWTQTYDFDYSVGWVRFYLTYSDFFTDTKPGGPITFYVILIW